jgi:hypothetical protein
MLADFLTKPLQGSLFIKYRDVLLGYNHTDSLKVSTAPSVPEERVEKGDELQTVDAAINHLITTGEVPWSVVRRKSNVRAHGATSHNRDWAFAKLRFEKRTTLRTIRSPS